MGISRISRKKNFWYFSDPCFFSPKTLKPSSYECSLHQRLFFCNFASSGSPPICSFDFNPLRKQPSLVNSSCGISSKCHFDTIPQLKEVTFSNLSNESPKTCSFISNALHELPSLQCGFSSKCNFDKIPLIKEVPFCNSSSGLSSSFHLFSSFSQSLLKLDVLRCSSSSVCSVSSSFGMTKSCNKRFFRFFSVSSTSRTLDSRASVKQTDTFDLEQTDGGQVNLSPNMNLKIIEIIKRGNDDMESKLSLAGSELKIESVTAIFQVLNCQGISGLRFFSWLRNNNGRWHSSAEVCSRIISNCGCLGDYETMRSLLHEFMLEKICLDENAFSFLAVYSSNQDSMMDSVRRLVNLLNEVGGSCRNSGICALIEMLCNLNLFEMANNVIEITGEKDAHYNILLRQRCRKGHFEEAHGIIREMRNPTVTSYNYLLGCLCKNGKISEACSMIEEMETKGIPADEITFEILIYNSCILGKVDHAKQWLDKMVDSSLQPRLSTHAVFLKAFFQAEQYEEAHNYVIDSSVKYKQSSSAIYSLLADLHQGKGDIMAARGIILEMMDKGLRPNFRVYAKILKQLQKTGRGYLTTDLKNRKQKFLIYDGMLPVFLHDFQ